jgi:copper transport protein
MSGRVAKLALALSLATAAPAMAAGVARAGTPVAARAFHVLLERAVPAAGDTVAVAPARLVLTFSGPIEQAGATLRLLGPSGEVWNLEGVRQPDDPRSLAGALPDLGAGGYRVEWRVISGDGHPIAGDFVFYVSGGDAPPGTERELAPPPAAAGGTDAMGGMVGMGDASGSQRPAHVSALLTGVRGGADLALLLLAGVLLFSAWGNASGPSRRTTTTTHALAVAAPLFAAAYAWTWTGEVLGAGASPGGVGSPAGESGFAAHLDVLRSLATGRALALECALAALAAWALLLARRPRVASGFAVLAVLAGGLAGHPASYTPTVAMPASALHQLAAASWAGGLLFLVTEAGSAGFAAAVGRVSRVALLAVVVVAATGLLQTWLMLGSVDQLLGTPFGLLVLAKVAGLAGLVALGAYHRYRLVPSLAAGSAPVRFPRSVAAELAAAVVVLAAVLSHIPPNP